MWGWGWGLASVAKKIALVWYKKKKEGKNTLSKSERKTVLLLASFIFVSKKEDRRCFDRLAPDA